MRFLIINSDYNEFLHWLYTRSPGLNKQPYREQMRARSESLFGVAGFYSSNLRKLGQEAYDIHANNEYMQKAWAREQGLRTLDFNWRHCFYGGIASWLKRFNYQRWFYAILAEQIKFFRPDVLLNQAFDGIDAVFLKEIKPYVRFLVGQIAAPFSKNYDFSCYDLIISAQPDFVDYFRQHGAFSELNRPGFESTILERLGETKRTIPVSFIGSLSTWHKERIALLNHINNRRVNIEMWGRGVNNLPKNSPLRRCYKKQVWGIDMYNILNDSKITLNNHIGVAGCFAGNMRLFEATGAGALLITDWKKNLNDMFDPGREVVVYHTPEECVELIQHYLNNEKERTAIARAGQQRTLREHTYYHRMQGLIEIITKYI